MPVYNGRDPEFQGDFREFLLKRPDHIFDGFPRRDFVFRENHPAGEYFHEPGFAKLLLRRVAVLLRKIYVFPGGGFPGGLDIVCIWKAHAIAAPMAVAVSAKPTMSSFSPLYREAALSESLSNNFRDSEGEAGICLPCRGFTKRYGLFALFSLFAIFTKSLVLCFSIFTLLRIFQPA